MMKWTLGTVGFLALAACAHQEPPAAPANPPAEAAPGPAPVAVTTAPAPAPAPPAAPPATNEERAKWFQECWAHFNAKDWAKFPACYSETASSDQVDSGFPVRTGRADILEKGVKSFTTEFPDANGELQLTLVNGNDIASLVLIRGTNSGPLAMPGGASAPATNKKIGVLFGQVLETTPDGRAVAKERFYSDAGSLLGQIGLSPAPHRKLIEKGAAEKPVVVATNGDVEKANLALFPKTIEAFNKHDLTALTALMTDDVTLSEGSAPADKVGKAAVKKSYQELFKGFSDLKCDVTKVWAAGDYVVSEGVFSGTNDGNIPSWKLTKTGKKVSARYLEVDKVVGGKLKNVWVMDNGMALAMQLGLGQKPAANAKKETPAAKPAAAPAKPAAATPTAAATPATPATPAKPATPATPATPAAKPATPATPAVPAAKPATPAAPAAPAKPAK